MPVYASLQDFGDTPPENLPRLLEAASELVTWHTRNDLFHTSSDGLATDASVASALRRATIRQVEVWVEAELDPLTGTLKDPPGIATTNLGTGSVTFDTAAKQAERAVAAHTIDRSAFRILRAAGLASAAVPYA